MSAIDPVYASHMSNLYRAHNGWLRGWLKRRLGCSEQAADLAQDAFVRLLTSREALQLQEPRAFLTTIARRVLANHFRRQALERAWLEALAALPEPLSVPLEEQAIMLETLVEIDRLLERLSWPVRKAFLLSQLDGLSHAEIAADLGVSVSTVKRYIVRAARQCYFPD